MSAQLSYRWNIFFRTLIASVGGLIVASFFVAVVATLFPAHKALATYSGMLLSFIVWLLVALWAFTRLPEKNGFRQSMAWLHTWTGLVAGWILFFVFVTGTASYANQEITRWMQPERPLASATSLSAAEQFRRGFDALQAKPEAASATNWTVDLIGDARNSAQLTARWSSGNAGQRGGGGGFGGNAQQSIVLDGHGEPAPAATTPRETAGGRALLRMHYALHYLPYGWAVRIVGICTLLMFAAIVTGVVTHKKIFTDFFTFRPAKGQRSWLDAHNLISVIALPFFLMITYSGLLFFLYAYLPLGVPMAYGFDEQKQQAYYAELAKETGSQRILGRMAERNFGGARPPEGNAAAPQGGRDMPRGEGAAMSSEGRGDNAPREGGERGGRAFAGEGERGTRGDAAQGGEGVAQREGNARGEGERGQRAEGAPPREGGRAVGLGAQSARFADLAAIVERTEQEWGRGEIRSVTVTAGTGRDAPPMLQLARAWGDSLRRGGNAPNPQFNAYTGAAIAAAPRNDPPANERIATAMIGLHEGLFARPALRWLYLLAGLLGCAMIATGLVLWTVKRRPQREEGVFHFGHSLVEKLNAATVAGLPFALAAYFWANRLIPADLPGRAQWEIHALFIVWAMTLAYALLRPLMHGWRELLAATAFAWLALPLLNLLTTGNHLFAMLAAGDWSMVGVEAVFVALGLVFGWATWKVHKKMLAPVPQRRARRKPQAAAPDVSASGEEAIA